MKEGTQYQKNAVFDWLFGNSKRYSNQIYHYTRCITPKCTMSLRGHLRVIPPASYTAPVEEMSQRWRDVGNTVSDLTSPRFESRTTRFLGERIITRPTGLI